MDKGAALPGKLGKVAKILAGSNSAVGEIVSGVAQSKLTASIISGAGALGDALAGSDNTPVKEESRR